MKHLIIYSWLFISCSSAINKDNTPNSMVLTNKVIEEKKIVSDIYALKPIPNEEEKELYAHLFQMTSQGCLDSVKLILEKYDVDLSRYDDSSCFDPIVYAASYSGNKELVQYLIDKGADPKGKSLSNETALHRAAWVGHLDIVKLLVNYGADLNLIYNANGGLSPLCCAAESGNIEVVKYLIENGANAHYINENSGASPLRSAGYKGHYDIFKYLAQMQPVNYDWQEALFYGLIGGNLDIVKYVVEEKGADVNKPSSTRKTYPIERAAQNKYISNDRVKPVEIIKYLVSKGAKLSDINRHDIFEWVMNNSDEATIEYMINSGVKFDLSPTPDGWTGLAMALDNTSFVLAKHFIKKTKDHTFRGSPLVVYFADGLNDSHKIIQFLIEEGVNNGHYTEALFRSVANSDSISAHLLLDAGANIKALDPDSKCNVLAFAHDYPIAKFLISKGADIDNKGMLENAWQNPALLQALEDVNVYPYISQSNMNKELLNAAEKGDAWTVKYMLKRGVNVDFYKDGDCLDKQTALMKNAIQGYSSCYVGFSTKGDKIQVSSEIAEILLNAGANPNMRDCNGKTALHYVSEKQFCRINLYPIPIGNRRDRELGTHGDPAMPPAPYHDLIGKLLIEKGADMNLADNDGDTPLIVAAKSGNSGMLKLLLEANADVDIKNKMGNDVFDYLHDVASFRVMKEAGLLNRIPQKQFNTAFNLFFTGYRFNNKYDVNELQDLIHYGADVNTEIFTKKNALMFVFERVYDMKWELAQVLIDNGINLNAEDNQGFTLPMTLIKKNEYKEKYSNSDAPVNLLFLLKNGIDLNYKTSTLFTLLGTAVCENRDDIIDLLIEYGAKKDLESEWWYIVKEKRFDKETIPKLQQLVKDGVDVNLTTPHGTSIYIPELNQEGITALMFFAAYDNQDVIKALLNMKADVNIKAKDGTTALSIAKKNRKQSTVDLLQKAGAR